MKRKLTPNELLVLHLLSERRWNTEEAMQHCGLDLVTFGRCIDTLVKQHYLRGSVLMGFVRTKKPIPEDEKLPTWIKVHVLPGPLYTLLAPIHKGDLVNIASWAKSCGMTPAMLISSLRDMVNKGHVSLEFFIEEKSEASTQ